MFRCHRALLMPRNNHLELWSGLTIKKVAMGITVEPGVGRKTARGTRVGRGLAGPIRTLRAFLALTKPRVIELLLVITAPVMILAQRGIPNLWLVLATLVGGAMSAGSANAFNCYIDRDIDRIMKRTQGRPLVTGELSDRSALVFAWVLGIASTLWLGLLTNWLAAALSVGAILFYVLVYTLLLKRRTPQNIVWGGAAGCMPVLIGWAAVTGSLSWTPVVLFGIVFLWTPPHYWPLSMRYRTDYESARVPMLGVVRNETAVGLQVVLYAWATLACSLLLVPVASMGILYTVVAVVSGGWFIWEAHGLYSRAIRGVEPKPMRVFHSSITYLTLLFLAVGVDPLLHIVFVW
jgi:heme o synthase